MCMPLKKSPRTTNMSQRKPNHICVTIICLHYDIFIAIQQQKEGYSPDGMHQSDGESRIMRVWENTKKTKQRKTIFCLNHCWPPHWKYDRNIVASLMFCRVSLLEKIPRDICVLSLKSLYITSVKIVVNLCLMLPCNVTCRVPPSSFHLKCHKILLMPVIVSCQEKSIIILSLNADSFYSRCPNQ